MDKNQLEDNLQNIDLYRQMVIENYQNVEGIIFQTMMVSTKENKIDVNQKGLTWGNTTIPVKWILGGIIQTLAKEEEKPLTMICTEILSILDEIEKGEKAADE